MITYCTKRNDVDFACLYTQIRLKWMIVSDENHRFSVSSYVSKYFFRYIILINQIILEIFERIHVNKSKLKHLKNKILNKFML